ncbi:hypothetical protein NIES2100_14520 [Calothrix sp. NIES-2100]|nr:hypothetical protein NIES2100_14520 [Calothrix sp. NIES-2100]
MLKEIEKCWLWAAIHHKDFSKCSLKMYKPPISIRSSFLSPYSQTLATVCIDLIFPELMLDIPYNIIEAYENEMKRIGVTVNIRCIIDDIPF